MGPWGLVDISLGLQIILARNTQDLRPHGFSQEAIMLYCQSCHQSSLGPHGSKFLDIYWLPWTPALPCLLVSSSSISEPALRGACTAQSLQKYQWAAVGLWVLSPASQTQGPQPYSPLWMGVLRHRMLGPPEMVHHVWKFTQQPNSTFHIRKAVYWHKQEKMGLKFKGESLRRSHWSNWKQFDTKNE